MEKVSLIYKFLVLSLMIEQMNLVVERLGLPPTAVTHPKQLKEWEVSLPRLRRPGRSAFQSIAEPTDVVDAYVRTAGIHFVGYTRGFGIIRLNKDGVEDWPDVFSRECVPATKVSTHLAYELARGWMVAAGVDVSALENRHPVDIKQDASHAKGRKLASPNFHVRWGYYPKKEKGQYTTPVGEVHLDAARKWLVRLQLNDLAFYKRPVPRITNGGAIALLPDEPVRALLKQSGMDYTNAFSLLETSPACRADGLRRMLDEAKQIVSSLQIEDQVEVKEELLKEAYVNPPAFGLGGLLQFERSRIRFDPSGRLCEIGYSPRGVSDPFERLHVASIISSNQAFQIATGRLAALSVDVDRLDREQPRAFYQWRIPERNKGTRTWVETPEFHLVWGETEGGFKAPVLKVVVYGDIGKVGRLELSDTSFWGRPAIAPPDCTTRTSKPRPRVVWSGLNSGRFLGRNGGGGWRQSLNRRTVIRKRRVCPGNSVTVAAKVSSKAILYDLAR